MCIVFRKADTRLHANEIAGDRSPEKSIHGKWLIALLLASGVIVNYIDRVNLSVAITQMKVELNLDSFRAGVLLSAYAWVYAALQIPSGAALDRYGVRWIGRISTLLWACASAATGAARGFAQLIAARLLLGAAEAPTFPGNAKAISQWFPREQRGLPTAVFDASAKFASVIGIPLVAFITAAVGWRKAFVATGLLSLVYSAFFWKFYRDPEAPHSAVPKQEQNNGLSVWKLLRMRKVLGLALGMAAYNYNFYLYLTWLPTYAHDALHLNLTQSGIYLAIPWLAATVTDLLIGGWMVDHLIARGSDPSRVRMRILVIGLAAAACVVGTFYAHSAAAAIFWITIAVSSLAAVAPVLWSIPGLIAPQNSVGKVGAIMNCAGNIPAIVAPILTGYLLRNTTSYVGPFSVAVGALVLGITSFLLLLRDTQPLRTSV